jgi:hypothetical protein
MTAGIGVVSPILTRRHRLFADVDWTRLVHGDVHQQHGGCHG